MGTTSNNQKQVLDGNNATLSVKVSKETYDLLNILAEGMEHGTNANDLLKMFIQAFIESAKHTGPVSPDMQLLLDMLRMDAGWQNAFNLADVKTESEVAQAVLILQQPGRKGFGMVKIDRPFMETARMTYCVDDILERVVEVSMKGLYQELRDIGNILGTESMRETLFTLCDAYRLTKMDDELKEELPQLGNYSDFGRAIEFGKRTKQTKRRTPDSEANRQQRIIFGEYEKTIHDMSIDEVKSEE